MSLLIPSLSGTGPSTFESDFFVEATKYLYGLNIVGEHATEEDTKKANQLWNQFLEKEGVQLSAFKTAVGADIQPANRTAQQIAALKTYMDKYNAFLIERLAYTADSDRINLSISEGTAILWTIYEIILELMRKVQQMQVVDSDALKFFSDYQKEYQNVINKAFLYSGSTAAGALDPAITHTDNVAATYNLGYGNITMGDVIQYLVVGSKKATIASSDNPTPSTTAELSFATPITAYPTGLTQLEYFKVKYDSVSKTYTINAKFVHSYKPDGSNDYTVHNEPPTDLNLVVGEDEVVDACAKVFSDSMGAMTTYLRSIPGVAPTARYDIRYPWPTVGSGDYVRSILTVTSSDNQQEKLAASTAIETRAARNRAIQTALDAIRTRQETTGDRAQQVQRLIDSSFSAQNQTASFLLSIVTQLKTLLSAICK